MFRNAYETLRAHGARDTSTENAVRLSDFVPLGKKFGNHYEKGFNL